jgi:phospholipid/cholesterol/gamma-HCH transport system ATP-binding protein
MDAGHTVLELAGVRASPAEDGPGTAGFELHLMPGELGLIDVPDLRRGGWLADLCCGLIPLKEGRVRFLGHDWPQLPDHYAAALRGRIGRVFSSGGWIAFLDIATNILLPQLHHTRLGQQELRERATQLSCAFGLPGLPVGHVDDLSALDLARCACVRAFLGEPALLLLESPDQGLFTELHLPLLDAVASARSRGGAILWTTRTGQIWVDRTVAVTRRWRMRDFGLRQVRRAE